MADFIPPNLKRFRSSIFSCAIFIFVGGTVFICIGTILLDGFAGTLHHWRLLLGISLFLSLPFSFVYSLALAVLSPPVAFSNDGIYAFSFSGKKRFLRWENILQIRRFRLFNLAYLRIYSKVNKDILWIPLFQSRPVEFLHEIGKFAPGDSPIRYFLKPGNP